MGDIAAVLLVPEDGDPHGLLRGGPCGARPPMAYQCPGCGWGPDPSDACDEDGLCLSCGADLINDANGNPLALPTALVLAWDGKPDKQGALIAAGGDFGVASDIYTDIAAALLGTHDFGDIARRLDHLGTLLQLDADGRAMPCPICGGTQDVVRYHRDGTVRPEKKLDSMPSKCPNGCADGREVKP